MITKSDPPQIQAHKLLISSEEELDIAAEALDEQDYERAQILALFALTEAVQSIACVVIDGVIAVDDINKIIP